MRRSSDEDELLRIPDRQGFRMTASSKLKIAVVAPMPSASVRTAAAAKPGDLRKLRSA